MARQDWFYDLAVLEGPRPRTPGVWGGIEGDIAGQADLQAALALKSDDATVQAALALKSDDAAVQAALALKADVAQTVEAFTFTTKQNDLAVASGTTILRWNGAGSTGITGIAAPASARVLTIVNASTDYLLWLENENTASVAANRLMLPDSLPAFLMPGDTITLFYDLTTARWRVLSWPTRGPAMGLTDFTDSSSISGVQSSVSGTGASAGGSASNWTTIKGHGVGGTATGTSGTGRAIVGSSNVSNFIPGHGCALFVARVVPILGLPDGTNTWAGWVGFSDAYDGTVDNAMSWELRWNGSAVELSQTVVSASTPTRSTTGSPTLAVNRCDLLGVFLNAAATRADFIYSTDMVNAVLAGSVSSGLPAVNTTGILSGCIGAIQSAGGASRGLYYDWLGARYQGVRV